MLASGSEIEKYLPPGRAGIETGHLDTSQLERAVLRTGRLKGRRI
jgi:hypothetical protein